MSEIFASYGPLIFWIGLAVFAGIVEGMTAAVVSVWFVVGAIVGAIAFGLGAPLWLQIALAVVSCGACIGVVRKFCLGTEKSNKEALALDNYAGTIESKRGVVSQTIHAGDIGQVKIEGEYWRARSFDDRSTIEENTQIIVYKVDGTTCIVAPAEE